MEAILPNCPECESEYTYEDRGLYICPMCNFEWTANDENTNEEENVISYQMSIDGKQKNHDYIRSKGSYDKTIEALKRLQESNLISIIKFTVNQINMEDIFDIMLLMDDLKVDFFSFSRMVPVTGKDDIYIQDANKYRSYLDKIYNCGKLLKYTKLMYYDPLWTAYFYEKREIDSVVKKANRVCGGCSMWENSFCIQLNGDILLCSRVPDLKVGNLFSESDSVIDINKVNEIRSLNDSDECKMCNLHFLCRGCLAMSLNSSSKRGNKDLCCWR